MKFTRLLSVVAAVVGAAALFAADEEGFKPLFNGKDLNGWDGNPKFWSVKDGAILGQTTAENPTKGNTFLIWKDGTVDDFVLRFSYRIKNGNSGVQYRSKRFDNWVVKGYQGDFESGKTYSGILYEEGGRGILAQRGEKVTIDENGKKNAEKVGDSAALQAGIKSEDWNEYEVTAQGFHFIHKINGKVTAEVMDNESAKRAESGILALQLHQGPPMTVEVKDIRIKRAPLGSKKN